MKQQLWRVEIYERKTGKCVSVIGRKMSREHAIARANYAFCNKINIEDFSTRIRREKKYA